MIELFSGRIRKRMEKKHEPSVTHAVPTVNTSGDQFFPKIK